MARVLITGASSGIGRATILGASRARSRGRGHRAAAGDLGRTYPLPSGSLRIVSVSTRNAEALDNMGSCGSGRRPKPNAAGVEPGDRVERRAVFGKASHGDELRFGSLDVSGQVGAAERGQPDGALPLRPMFAEAEEVGEGRQLRRAGR